MIANDGSSGIAARMKNRRRPNLRPSQLRPRLSDRWPIVGLVNASSTRATPKMIVACAADSPQKLV
jgi:hypothetical protein